MNSGRSNNSLTLVGIDGLGVGIDSYIRIFELCSKELEFEKILLFTSAPGYSVDIPADLQIDFIQLPKLTYKEFNTFCLTGVTEFVETSHVLFVQTDGFICNGSNWKDYYYDYDYIGQPWIQRPGVSFPWVRNVEESVGEGGFSLRSKKLLQLVSSLDYEMIRNAVQGGYQEDVFISSYLRDYLTGQGCKFATPEIGSQFCSGLHEFNYDKLDTSFGFHANEYVEEVLSRYYKKYGLNYHKDVINYKNQKINT